MNRGANQRIQVPDDLREVLLEFTISYLLEQPADVVNYAADYFSRLRESRSTVLQSAPTARSGDGEGVATSPDESVISNEDGKKQDKKREAVGISELNKENYSLPGTVPVKAS